MNSQHQKTQCPRTSNFLCLEHIDTHERVPITCNTYRCPVCGPIKIWKLKKALTSLFQSWKTIRFWTLSMKNDIFESPDEQYRVLMEAWRYFITYVRRSKALTKFQSEFKYVKIPEQHKSGYWHLHVVVDRFINREVLQRIWERIIQEFLNRDSHVASIYVELIPNAKNAASYICKYITKSIHDKCNQKRFYSTSYHLKIFQKTEKSGNWYVVFLQESDIERRYVNFISHEGKASKTLESPLLVNIESNITNVQEPLLLYLPDIVPKKDTISNIY